MPGVDAVHGLGDALFEGNQGFAEGGAADLADDAGGNVLVGLVAHGALQPGFGVAVLVEQ